MERKIGVVRVVARNGGLKFEDEDVWYNAAETLQSEVTPELKGRVVELDLIAPNMFTAIRELPQLSSERDALITRQVAVKTAAEFAKASPGLIDTTQKLLAAAEEIERWIKQ